MTGVEGARSRRFLPRHCEAPQGPWQSVQGAALHPGTPTAQDHPNAGLLIGLGRQGKRGGGRVIYFLASAEIIYLILAYPKNVKDNLTATEKAALKALTSRLKEEAP